MWGRYQFMEWMGDTVDIQLGPFSRHLRVPLGRLREYLVWLEAQGYIRDLDVSRRGLATLAVNVPEDRYLHVAVVGDVNDPIEFELDQEVEAEIETMLRLNGIDQPKLKH
jgi:hypothetical protein